MASNQTLPDMRTLTCQVLNTLFFVETRRIENPRNILQLLSMNTRRTKVVELSSGTHRWATAGRGHCHGGT